ncbi:MAG: hypothetical protein WCW47_00615 [Candidatus Paceibacterota bacterium]|jgi:hypothetical protein
MFESLIHLFQNDSFLLTLKIVYYSSFIFIPFFLVFILTDLWIQYKRAKYFAKQEYLLLEIKVPRDVFKSPKAMEFFLNGLSQPYGETWYTVWTNGAARPWFSLEIVSISGVIHFFIWTRKSYKNAIEANLYSQYPGIEIFVVPDYVQFIKFDPENVGLFTTEFALTKSDAYPIKTYVDYGMEKDPKEEFKVDPLTPMIEFLGSIGQGHQVWIQILVRAHVSEDKDKTTGKKVDLKWKKAAEKEIEDIIKKSKGEKDKDGKPVPGTNRMPTDGESETIKALERSISKLGYDVGIRAIYTAPKDIFDGSKIGGIIGGITHFNSGNLNGFRPKIAGGSYVYPWQDRKKKKTNFEKQDMFDAYKRRAYFYKPYKRNPFVLNTEELATIFHFPGSVSSTPTFTRIESRKGEAPANLPI